VSNDYLHAPIDHNSAESLQAGGLRLGLVDTADAEQFASWLQAEARGFHDGAASAETIAGQVAGLAYRRTTGVWDDTAADAASPVATVSSWSTPVTVPGDRAVEAWAVSAVTVSPTHRRRGIARAMLEAELRTARSLGVPLAMLTVSEATIYGRFGFAPAVMAADWKIDTRRAHWTGPTPNGRLNFITVEQLKEQGPAIVEEVRLQSPGEIEPWPLFWDRALGLTGSEAERPKNLRVVRYDDAAGEPQGFATYVVNEVPGDVFGHSLEVRIVSTATDDAYAAIWRYLIEMDLVGDVIAPLRAVDEAFAWQISDFRAATKTRQRDHLWTRIIDVKAALEARRYSAQGSIVLEVSDDLGFAEGRFLLSIADDGTAQVRDWAGAAPDNSAIVALGVSELSALYLGGVSAVTLTRAGRITELHEGSSSGIDASFRSPITPWLSIWF
jgi:predicted acetyltransferase